MIMLQLSRAKPGTPASIMYLGHIECASFTDGRTEGHAVVSWCVPAK